ncbi:YheC/YheD family protein [Paenibacillus athensensis]|uniref:YheC/YheD family protein n=1 Tax=Paenibacillus athensensis TaxID=1967502 RepID=UPI0014304D77|nr:YheC/YheD family protein [Paenibacillus athensensis]MCD1258028.1 YheC/YheD family protein [Paenibacillus athensensis]
MLIGVFHPHDPFSVMTENRVQAIVAESVRQDVQLVFFNEAGIDLDQMTVSGVMFEEGVWNERVLPFPQAIMNIRPWGPRRRSDRELIFRKLVPFTAFLIDNKWEITKMLAEHPVLAKHLVPTAVLEDASQITELLEAHSKLVIKPVQGSRGEGVQAMVRRNDQYGLQAGADWTWMNRTELDAFVAQLNREYLIQPYIVCLTPEQEPFDFRVLVQRDGCGEWNVTIIYPRIGAINTITSNVSVGGRTEPVEPFLQRLFPGQAESLSAQMTALGLELAAFIDSHYAHPLNELGIDLAIDAERRIWFYEANTCPGTLYHEQERAVQAVAYVKYIAEQANPKSRLPAHSNEPFSLGLLFSEPPEREDLEAFADVAGAHGVQLAYFLLEDISFRAGSISGYWREGPSWSKRLFAFPDRVYNLMEQTDLEAAYTLYRPSSNLQLTSNEPKGPVPSSLFFAVASRHAELAAHLPQFVRPEGPEEAQHFIDRCGLVVMKTDNARQLEDVLMIRRLTDRYVVQEEQFVHTLTASEFQAFLQLFYDSGYILIEQISSSTHDGHALHLRMYMTKTAEGAWRLLHIAPLLALASDEPQAALPCEVKWDWLLDREFPEMEGIRLNDRLHALTCTMAEQLNTASRHHIHELILDAAIDSAGTIRLLGGEYEGPAGVVHPYEAARYVIPYALILQTSQYAKALHR